MFDIDLSKVWKLLSKQANSLERIAVALEKLEERVKRHEEGVGPRGAGKP